MNLTSGFLLGLVSALTLAASGCDSTGCTEVGCTNQVQLTVTGVYAAAPKADSVVVTVCAQGRCPTYTVTRSGEGATCEAHNTDHFWDDCELDANGSLKVTFAFESQSPAELSVKVDAGDGAPLERTSSVTTSTSEPNGPDCEPVCQSGKSNVAL